jgi:arylsulfatase A-like enzyme
MYTGTWCMPSRATFLTGLLQHGVESLRMEGEYPGSTYDPQQSPFWSAEFRRAGYVTAQIGKWHVGTDAGFGRDWDFQAVWNRPALPANAGNYYFDQMISFNGGEPRLVAGYATDNYTQWAEEFIAGKGRDADQPWLLWLCYTGTHGPFTPAPRHDDAIAQEIEVPQPPGMFGPRPGKPRYIRERQDWVLGDDGKAYTNKRPPAGGEWNASVKNYHETALSLDEAVGRLAAALQATGQWENTLVIFTSDQGFAWGQHGLQHKMAPYDASLASPLIVTWPGRIPANAVERTPVGGHDLVPTLFHYAGLEPPWPMHGRDISPMLSRPGALPDHGVLLTYTDRQYGSDTRRLPQSDDDLSINQIPWWASWRQQQYKYILNLVPGEVEELYDLETDPDERHNLAMEPRYQATVIAYRKRLLAELEHTGAPFLGEVRSWFP